MKKILIKADDLRLDRMAPGWKRFLSFCSSNDIHVNAGVIGAWPGDKRAAKTERLGATKEMFEEVASMGGCTLWNHGNAHERDKGSGTSEFRGASFNAQVASLRATQRKVEQLSGIRMEAFGPPYNWYDQSTILALQQVDSIKYVFYIPYVPGKVCYNLESFVECEPFQGPVKPGAKRMFSIEQARARSGRFLDIDRSFVLQVHPNSWIDGALDAFGKYIDELRAQGYQPVNIQDFRPSGAV